MGRALTMNAWPGRRRAACGVAGLLGLLLALPATAAASLTAALDPDTIRMGETAVLVLSFSNAEPRAAPVVPTPPGLRIQFEAQSRQFESVNGVTTTTLNLSYRVRPVQAGVFTIPAVTMVVDGKPLASQPLTLRVLRADERAPDSSPNLAFLKLTVPKRDVFLGEVLTVDQSLYLAVNAQELQPQPLAGDGFTLGKVTQVPVANAQVGNQRYTVVRLQGTAVASKAGDLKLGPAQWNLTLKVPVSRRARSMDFFEDSIFGNRVELRPVELTSETHQIHVRPLPTEGRPATFTGAVGDFRMTATVSPTNVAVGEPVTLRVQVSGRGALDNLTLPSLEEWREFKTYPPTSKVELTNTLGIEGVKTFDLVVVPQNTEIKEVPAFAFSFFDPDKRAYQTLKQPSVGLIVRPSAAVPLLAMAPTNAASAASSATVPQDIVPVKPHLGMLTPAGAPLLRQPWFQGLQVAPVLGFLWAWGWRRRRDYLAQNPRLIRRQRVARLVREGLAELHRLAAVRAADEFFAAAFRLLQEQLGERLDVPAAAITEAVLEERLAPRGVSAGTLAELHELFQACNQARYAPATSAQELMSLVPRLEAALAALARLDLEPAA
jgi:hypothetical protein